MNSISEYDDHGYVGSDDDADDAKRIESIELFTFQNGDTYKCAIETSTSNHIIEMSTEYECCESINVQVVDDNGDDVDVSKYVNAKLITVKEHGYVTYKQTAFSKLLAHTNDKVVLNPSNYDTEEEVCLYEVVTNRGSVYVKASTFHDGFYPHESWYTCEQVARVR